MAREHARIWLDINTDDEFETLPFDAQGLYTRVILTLDDLSYCGVADWRPKRLTTKAPDLSYRRIIAAAAALESGRYCLFDLDTEQVLVRSYIRRDELLRNPKMAAAVVKAFPGIASKTLRAAVVDEIRRINDEHPEYSSWAHKEVGPALAKIMAKEGSGSVPYTNQITNLITNGQAVNIGDPQSVPITDTDSVRNGNAETVPITETDLGPDHQSDSVPIPSTYTSTSTPAPLGGYVTGERHQAIDLDSNGPPPRYCPSHMPSGTLDKCNDCKTQLRIFDSWMAEATVEQKQAAQERARAEAAQRVSASAARALAIAACDLCDDDGYTPTLSVCDHVDRTETNARGIAAVRAALAKDAKDAKDGTPEPGQLDDEPEDDQ